MSSLGDRLRAMSANAIPAPAPTPTLSSVLYAATAPGNWGGGQAVGDSADLQRILALPRRHLGSTYVPHIERGGCDDAKCPLNGGLRDIQAQALAEAQTYGGLLAPIGVGFGKTLISLLLPTVMESRKAVLLVPPQLREQLLQRDIPHLAQHFCIPNLVGGNLAYPDTKGLLWVVSYSALSSAKQADVLEDIGPDLVVADEAHSVRHTTAARTKRFTRYFKKHPETRLCAMSGTLTSRSIKDYAHLAKYALKDGSPLPENFKTLVEWSWALDSSDTPAPPGALLAFCKPGEDVREGFRRRLVETPGVVATDSGALGTSLVFYDRPVKLDAATTKALTDLRLTWAFPDGDTFSDALTFHRAARQLSCGVYLKWIWPREEPLPVRMRWLSTRKDWHKAIREKLKTASQGMDSPLLLARAAARGDWDCPAYAPWAETKDTARPETEAVWVSDCVVRNAVEWGQKNVGVIWTETVAVGERIAELGGFPFYGAGKEASAAILGESGKRTIVAGIKSHGTGKNLQMFETQLITSCPSNGATMEQLLGRLHRPGQNADEVQVHVYRHTAELAEALESAHNDARYIRDSMGSEQKLLAATYTFPLPHAH